MNFSPVLRLALLTKAHVKRGKSHIGTAPEEATLSSGTLLLKLSNRVIKAVNAKTSPSQADVVHL